MTQEIINRIASVINALDNTEAKGKQNMMNIVGSIDILEDCLRALSSTLTSNGTDVKQE